VDEKIKKKYNKWIDKSFLEYRLPSNEARLALLIDGKGYEGKK
jgi:hypothetical protein